MRAEILTGRARLLPSRLTSDQYLGSAGASPSRKTPALPMLRSLFTLLFVALATEPVGAQEPGPPPAWPSPLSITTVQAVAPAPLPLTAGPPPAPPIPTGLPERPAAEPVPELPDELPGQQHWVAINITTLQPFTGRVQVKVRSRPNNSIWLEAYLGSVLFDVMYGGGVRLMHTAKVWPRGDVLMASPGLGVHMIPAGSVLWGNSHGVLSYLAADVDVAWLHDFSPHVGFELGVKVGLAGLVGGRWNGNYPRAVTFGSDLYPIVSVYSGLRF